MSMQSLLATVGLAAAAGITVEWTQTARNGDGSLVLLKDMEPLKMKPVPATDGPSITVDRSKSYQTFAGFGGAFTEARRTDARGPSPVPPLPRRRERQASHVKWRAEGVVASTARRRRPSIGASSRRPTRRR